MHFRCFFLIAMLHTRLEYAYATVPDVMVEDALSRRALAKLLSLSCRVSLSRYLHPMHPLCLA